MGPLGRRWEVPRLDPTLALPRLPALPRTPAQSGFCSSEGPLARGRCLLPRPKSLAGSSPSTRLLTLEEAQARTQGRLGTTTEPTTPKTPASPVERYSQDAGEGRISLEALVPQTASSLCHPNSRRKRERAEKQRKPGGSSWKTFFALGRGPSIPRKKPLPWLGGSRAPPQPSGQRLRPRHACVVLGVGSGSNAGEARDFSYSSLQAADLTLSR